MNCSKPGCKCGEVAFAATQSRPSCAMATVSCKSDLYGQILRSYVGGTERELFVDFCTAWPL